MPAVLIFCKEKGQVRMSLTKRKRASHILVVIA